MWVSNCRKKDHQSRGPGRARGSRGTFRIFKAMWGQSHPKGAAGRSMDSEWSNVPIRIPPSVRLFFMRQEPYPALGLPPPWPGMVNQPVTLHLGLCTCPIPILSRCHARKPNRRQGCRNRKEIVRTVLWKDVCNTTATIDCNNSSLGNGVHTPYPRGTCQNMHARTRGVRNAGRRSPSPPFVRSRPIAVMQGQLGLDAPAQKEGCAQGPYQRNSD